MANNLYVLGSGPASVSCVHALVRQGWHVTVLDAGLELEPERQEVVNHLQQVTAAEWDARSIQIVREGSRATANGIPVKRVYGSDFPYREVTQHVPLVAEHVTPFTSFAKGGLSNVWGAAVVPYRPADISDWPVSAAELAPYYHAVFDFVPLAAAQDDLEDVFPLYSTTFQRFMPSVQAKRILEHLARHRDELGARGFIFGQSRLAVRVAGDDTHRECAYCRLCMYGCPYDLIYKSTHTLDPLVRSGRVTYIKDVVVDELIEADQSVTIAAHERTSGGPLSFSADRVFVGCGVLPTAQLMLKSLKAHDATLTMRDSQYFLLPLLGLHGAGNVERETFHTLSQVFVEMFDEALGPYPVHLQIYTYNDLYASAVKSMLRAAYPLVKAPASLLLSRLMVIQGYLHSNISSTVAVSLHGDELRLKKNPLPTASQTVRRAVAKLRRNARLLGFAPISPLLNIGHPGQGAHFGGTFPMRQTPGPLESDTMGRPYGFTRVHIVDASVLPSIPSTTITLNAMANAYRIGSEWHTHVA